MSWIMKANIVYDNEAEVYANNKLYCNLREIIIKWDVMNVVNSIHEKLLPIGTILKYKNIEVEIIGYSEIHDGKDYIIQPVDESIGFQRIVRYDDENLEVVK